MKWFAATFLLLVLFSCEKSDNAKLDFEIVPASFKAGEHCFLLPKIKGNFKSVTLIISEIGYSQTHKDISLFSFTVPNKGFYTFELVVKYWSHTEKITKIIEAKPGNGNLKFVRSDSEGFFWHLTISVTGIDVNYSRSVYKKSYRGINNLGTRCEDLSSSGFDDLPGGKYKVDIQYKVHDMETIPFRTESKEVSLDNNCVRI